MTDVDRAILESESLGELTMRLSVAGERMFNTIDTARFVAKRLVHGTFDLHEEDQCVSHSIKLLDSDADAVRTGIVDKNVYGSLFCAVLDGVGWQFLMEKRISYNDEYSSVVRLLKLSNVVFNADRDFLKSLRDSHGNNIPMIAAEGSSFLEYARLFQREERKLNAMRTAAAPISNFDEQIRNTALFDVLVAFVGKFECGADVKNDSGDCLANYLSDSLLGEMHRDPFLGVLDESAFLKFRII